MATVAAVSLAATAHAQHRARLSADLQDHLQAGSANIEVIVDGANADRLAAKYNLQIKRRLRNGSVLVVNAGQLSALKDDADVDHLSGNIRYRSSSIDPVDQGIGADQVWAGAGTLQKFSGRGIAVALIDSGVDVKHNAIKGKVVTTVDFTGGDGSDLFGHGTHVAAIIAGNPGTTADTAMYRGVAYGASLVNLRVLGNDGSGTAADVIEAIDWAVDHAKQFNIRIINLSLGAPVLQPYRDDPVCAAVERAVRAGLLVVTAAGNHGTNAAGKKIAGGITSPGNSPYALTVGALDTKGTADRGDDEVAAFSSAGPTAFDLVLKPDVAAPGRHITSAESVGSLLSTSFPDQHVAGSGSNSYFNGSGTSMAAAVVSGAAALLLEERPSLSPLAVKVALQMSAEFLAGAGIVREGAGSLNVLAAADYVKTHDLSGTTIAGDAIAPSHLAIVPIDQIVTSETVVLQQLKTARKSLRTLSIAKTIAQPNGDSVIWGNGDSVIWGNGDSVIWGNGDSVIWGNSDSVIWGNGDSVIWGNGDSVIWGNGDSVIWGNGDSVIWGNSDSVIWGNSDSVIWGNSDSVIWGK
jgi:serine protease AprX